jgi:hypothetical protein
MSKAEHVICRKHFTCPKIVLPVDVLLSYFSVAQPFYTRGTLNIVEESWRHTNPSVHIVVGGGGGGAPQEGV